MLEVIYKEVIDSFNQEFLSLYNVMLEMINQGNRFQEDDNQIVSVDQIEELMVEAKHSAGCIGLLEFYLSAFMHHFRMDGSHCEVHLVRPRFVTNATMTNETIIRFVNSNDKGSGSFKLENYDYKMLFLRVKPHMLMQIFVSLLQERKVILILGGGSNVTHMNGLEGLTSEEDCR